VGLRSLPGLARAAIGCAVLMGLEGCDSLGTSEGSPDVKISDDEARTAQIRRAAKGVDSTLYYARTIRCDRFRGTVATWGETRASTSPDTSGPTLVFDQIDLAKGTARFVGNAGTSDVTVQATRSGLLITEMTAIGTPQVTFIYNISHETAGTYLVTHSRHTSLPGSPLPSQYHGVCRVQ
jgi:hypothetical protein